PSYSSLIPSLQPCPPAQHPLLFGTRQIGANTESWRPVFLIHRSYLQRFIVVKNRISLALIALLSLSIALPAFVFAQQGRQSPPVRKSPNEPAGITSPRGRTNRARTMSNLSAQIEQDFSEALTVIQDNYVDGNR